MLQHIHFVTILTLAAMAASAQADVSPLAAKNVLTKAELDHLRFPAPGAADAGERKQLSLGVWAARAEFRPGEPIHVLFAVKNHDSRPRGLDMWLTERASESITWNEARVHIETDAKAGLAMRSHIYSCGDSALSTVDANSYLCVRADLRGRKLTPGNYTLWWSYGKLVSNKTQFRLLENSAEVPHLDTVAGHIHWIDLQGVTSTAKEGQHLQVTQVVASKRFAEGIDRRLAAGHGKFFYPDLLDLPSADERIKATAKFTNAKELSTIEVRLQPSQPDAKYHLNGTDLHIALLVAPRAGATARESGDAWKHDEEGRPDLARRERGFTSVRELTLRVDLPENWQRKLSFHGPGKCTLVLTTERIRDSRAMMDVTRRLVRGGDPVWEGLVRTPWLEFDAPR